MNKNTMKLCLVAAILGMSLACIAMACSAQQVPKSRPVATGEKLTVTPRQAYEIYSRGTTHSRVFGSMLGDAIVRSKVGHEQFRQLLTDPDPDVALFAVRTIQWAVDFDDIPYLRDAMVAPNKNPRVVDPRRSSLHMLLGTPSSGFPSNMNRCKKWLRKNEALWKDGSYAHYWGSEIQKAFNWYKKGRPEGEGYLVHAIVYFAFNREPEAAAAIVMEWIGKISSDDKAFPLMLSGFVSALQVHVGPLIPQGTDVEKECEQVRAALLDWWAVNKDKNPTEWKMANLTTRGYQLSTPEDASLTVKECLRAIASGDGIERYTAASVLADILPCGDPIIFDVIDFKHDTLKPLRGQVIDFLRADISQRAHRFLVVDRNICSWDPQACKYVKKNGG